MMSNQQEFNRTLAQLRDFRAQHPGQDLPQDESFHSLRRWLKGQRAQYQGNSMPEAHRQAFAKTAMIDWLDPRPDDDLDLEVRLMAIESLVSQHGWEALSCLADFRDPAIANIKRWLDQLSRVHHGQALDPCLQERLAYLGVRLENAKPLSLTATISGKVFNTKLAALISALDEAERHLHQRDLRRRNVWRSRTILEAWHFVEHLAFKARNGLLPDYQRDKVIALRFTVDGLDIRDVLGARHTMLGDERGVRIVQSGQREARAKTNPLPHLGGLRSKTRPEGIELPPTGNNWRPRRRPQKQNKETGQSVR